MGQNEQGEEECYDKGTGIVQVSVQSCEVFLDGGLKVVRVFYLSYLCGRVLLQDDSSGTPD
ncbi:hypothetical protein HOLleu_22828 [Holothuria leucospilota]|uniref:Uncharacterized protein n=1 Tax=Holothuria leucospilota TaxID=206669 RepID=A0A9Q1BTA2_HOLLE|nr:hypothetical protein HOLleu_22828 [Holothuria leucospilota]